MKPLLAGLVAGYLLACCVPLRLSASGSWGGGNLRGNAGGFAGGNPGMPQGPGFRGP